MATNSTSKAPHLEAFLEAANYFIGAQDDGTSYNNPVNSKLSEIYSLAGMGWCAWCAIFICACAKKAGILDTLIYRTSMAGWLQEGTVLYCGGTWVDGPYINGGSPVTPIPGDIISFAYESRYSGRGHASHVGIVEYVEGNTIHTIEGNSGNKCTTHEYALDTSTINAYVRPDWSAVGDDISSYLAGAGGYVVGPLYQNRNTRHDMTMREVGYVDTNYSFTNKATGLKLSIINYTTLLGDLYDLFAPAYLSLETTQIDTSELEGNTKIAMDYFLAEGFSASGAASITGSLKIYSDINPAYSHKDLKTYTQYYGICAWKYDKLKLIKERVGDGWQDNLSGQLQYLIDDLRINYSGMASIIKYLELSEKGAESGAQLFMATYNSDFNLLGNKERAKKAAVEIYNKLKITTVIVGNVNNLRDSNGNKLSAQYSVAVPGSVPQTGIIDDYTSYSAWYSRWHVRSPQKKLAVLWGEQGFPCDKGIATIGGYYCVAVRPKFGKCGEVIVVTLEDSTSFACIICDEKGEDAGSEWGHVKGSGNISLIEWERVKTENGKVITGTGYSDVDSRGFGDWYGKRVSSITNYGTYMSVGWS